MQKGKVKSGLERACVEAVRGPLRSAAMSFFAHADYES